MNANTYADVRPRASRSSRHICSAAYQNAEHPRPCVVRPISASSYQFNSAVSRQSRVDTVVDPLFHNRVIVRDLVGLNVALHVLEAVKPKIQGVIYVGPKAVHVFHNLILSHHLEYVNRENEALR